MRVIGSGSICVRGGMETALKTLREQGFDEVDLLFISGWAHIDMNKLSDSYDAVSGEIRSALSRYGMKAASFNTKLSVPIEDRSAEAVGQRKKEVAALMCLMDELDVPIASVQPTLTGNKSYLQETFWSLIDEVAQLQQVFKREGRLLPLEPHVHSAICTKPAIEAALQRYPDLQFVYDPSHLIHSGESIYDTQFLMRYATMAHMRDSARGKIMVPYGTGDVDLKFALVSLWESGYHGPVSIEYISDYCDVEAMCDMKAFTALAEQIITDLKACPLDRS